MPTSHLLSGAEIRAFRPRKRFHGTLLSIGTSPRTGHLKAGIAFIVSKQVAPKATARNAIKRTLKETARGLLRSFPPAAIVVSVKRAAGQASPQELRADLLSLLAEVRVAQQEERATMPQS